MASRWCVAELHGQLPRVGLRPFNWRIYAVMDHFHITAARSCFRSRSRRAHGVKPLLIRLCVERAEQAADTSFKANTNRAV